VLILSAPFVEHSSYSKLIINYFPCNKVILGMDGAIKLVISRETKVANFLSTISCSISFLHSLTSY